MSTQTSPPAPLPQMGGICVSDCRLQAVMQNSAAMILNATTTATVTVQQITNGKRRLLQSGPIVYVQVIWQALTPRDPFGAAVRSDGII